jgi:hypothetical protein
MPPRWRTVEDTLAVLAGCLGEIVVGRSAAEFLRKSSVKDSRAVDEGGGVGAACSVRAGSAALGFFHLLQGCGRSPWVLFVFGGEAERCLSVRAVAVCSGEAAMLEECEVVVWCVGGKLGEVGDQELRGVCFGGGGVLLRRFPGRLLPKPAEPGSARSGHSRGLANHRAPEYSYHLPATSLHLLSFSFPEEAISPARSEVGRASTFVKFRNYFILLSRLRLSQEAHLQTLSTIQSEGIADRGGAIREHQTARLHAR